MKAKFIRCVGYDKYDSYRSPIYEYEYKGNRYFVIDYKNDYTESMAKQHYYEQNRIDKIIKEEEYRKTQEYKNKEDASVGFDAFLEYIETGVENF